MVKLQLHHDREKKESEPGILHRVALGYSFNDEKSIFKNIHSFLKPKNKEIQKANHSDAEKISDVDVNHHSETKADNSFKSIEASSQASKAERVCSFHEDERYLTSAKSSQMGRTNSDTPEPRGKYDRSGSFTASDRPCLSFSHSYTPYDSPESTSPLGLQFQNAGDFVLAPQQHTFQRSLRRNSYSSLNGNSGNRPYRYTNLSSAKKSRKSLKKNRESLRRYNSTDTSHTSTIAQQAKSDNISCTRKAFTSILCESQIPFHLDENNTNDQFPRITAQTLQRILRDELHKDHYESYCIIDCRFEYEFKGGHVTNALNISSREELEQEFIQTSKKGPILLIFHCEFSSYRGPMMASHLRNCDRMINYDNYPDLYYPDILILDGGYKGFFDEYPNLCFPRKYVGMDSSENLTSRDQEMERFRNDSKKMISRNSSSHKLTAVPSSSKSSFMRTSSNQDLVTGLHKFKPLESPAFKYEAPPRVSLRNYSQNNIFASSDDFSSASKISVNSSPNLSANQMLLMDGVDNDSCYSFEEGDSTFTTPIEMLNTPSAKYPCAKEQDNSPLNPVKRLLFSGILHEEETEISE